MRRTLPLFIACLVLAGCAAGPPSGATVGSPGRPVLVVAYTPNEAVRVAFEDQLEADLAAKDVSAVQSHDVVETFTLVTPRLLLDAAEQLDAPMILLVRRLITTMPEDGASPPPDVRRHRTLREYFAAVGRKRLPDIPPPGRQVIEVSGYLVNGDATELVWSGYSWVDFDGDLDAAIRETSEVIARNLAPACQGISCDF